LLTPFEKKPWRKSKHSMLLLHPASAGEYHSWTPPGKQLSKARLEKGLTVDEVAYATKLRPDKVLALEHDDYGRFPNNAYVKGFLQIYGRYLGVDVSGAVKDLENPSPVSVSDYQYLNSVPVPETPRLTARKPREETIARAADRFPAARGGGWWGRLSLSERAPPGAGSIDPGLEPRIRLQTKARTPVPDRSGQTFRARSDDERTCPAASRGSAEQRPRWNEARSAVPAAPPINGPATQIKATVHRLVGSRIHFPTNAATRGHLPP
jgi:hypothetical protein